MMGERRASWYRGIRREGGEGGAGTCASQIEGGATAPEAAEERDALLLELEKHVMDLLGIEQPAAQRPLSLLCSQVSNRTQK